ncbi:MAG TPA: SDR family NAD(P)-dependent oxidoreductase [Stellaceae bacterium]|nr:SDR family NAD(P)-dependent oxidoreductase [Stellaceae bacterium]
MQGFDLGGKVALVTGAGSGLGRAFAHGLAAAGARVVCVDRNRGWAEETAAGVRPGANDAVAIEADVADAASVTAMAARAGEACGRIDILVNNAGIATVPQRVHEMPVEDWDRLIAINLRGVFLCTRAVLPVMLAGGGGSIISIASIIGLVGYYPGTPAVGANYAAAKAGVVGFTRQVAIEYARDNIRANAIAPGWHGGTRLGDTRRAALAPEAIAAFEAAIRSQTPMGRRGTPDELEGLAVFLASDASRYITGQVFVQDGGWTAA